MSEGEMSCVLFVDDDAAILDGLKRSVWREPYDVLTATSGAQGLEALANTRIDVVVSDERMAGMTGSQFLHCVRSTYPNVVLIMLTGDAALPNAVRAIQDGPLYRFLNKPIDAEHLRQVLRQAIQMK